MCFNEQVPRERQSPPCLSHDDKDSITAFKLVTAIFDLLNEDEYLNQKMFWFLNSLFFLCVYIVYILICGFVCVCVRDRYNNGEYMVWPQYWGGSNMMDDSITFKVQT